MNYISQEELDEMVAEHASWLNWVHDNNDFDRKSKKKIGS